MSATQPCEHSLPRFLTPYEECGDEGTCCLILQAISQTAVHARVARTCKICEACTQTLPSTSRWLTGGCQPPLNQMVVPTQPDGGCLAPREEPTPRRGEARDVLPARLPCDGHTDVMTTSCDATVHNASTRSTAEVSSCRISLPSNLHTRRWEDKQELVHVAVHPKTAPSPI